MATSFATLTVARVSSRAGVSSALIHYHFSTKRQLIAAAAGRLADERLAARLAPFGDRGLAVLDALWATLVALVDRGTERAWLELVALAREDADVRAALLERRRAEQVAIERRLPGLLEELGAARRGASEELAAALGSLLDGMALALAAGEPPEGVRTAYDAFWIAMIAAAQSGRRR